MTSQRIPPCTCCQCSRFLAQMITGRSLTVAARHFCSLMKCFLTPGPLLAAPHRRAFRTSLTRVATPTLENQPCEPLTQGVAGVVRTRLVLPQIIVPAFKTPTMFEAISSSLGMLAARPKTCGSVENRYITPTNCSSENNGCAQNDLATNVRRFISSCVYPNSRTMRSLYSCRVEKLTYSGLCVRKQRPITPFETSAKRHRVPPSWPV